MTSRTLSVVLQETAKTSNPDADGELVRRFAESRDPTAFADLVRRHAPMVLGVCRRVTGHPQDAEDAFQAAFLVLATKADAVQPPGAVGGWLHGVAFRTAARARTAAARRRARETELTDVTETPTPDPDPLLAVLDAELAKLPEKYRAPVVLCELEGRSLKEAAQTLGIPAGTVASRLARGRDRLAAAVRRQVPAATSAALLAAVTSASAQVSPRLASAAVTLGTSVGPVSESISELSQGVIRDMFLTKLRSTARIGLCLVAAIGAAALAVASADPVPPAPGKNGKQRTIPPFAGKPDDAGKHVAAGNTAFGVDLYAKLADEKAKGKNVFFSPLSVSAALAMTAAGADGNTFTEMQTGLHLPKDESATDAGFQHLFTKINDKETPEKLRGYSLRLANAIWAQKGFPWADPFLGRVKGSYGAGIIDADFQNQPEPERLRINGWVEKETNDKIKDLLPEESIKSVTRMVLTNAVYFKGDWQTQFKKDTTRPLPFTRGDGTKVDAPMMFRMCDSPVVTDSKFRAVELPYKGGQVSMIVLLPTAADGLPKLEKALTAENLATLTRTLGEKASLTVGKRPEPYELYLPKFKIETKYDLILPLQQLGMKSMLRGGFGRLTEGSNSLFVSGVFHKAFVEVNEEGTEAAAATAVVLSDRGAHRPPAAFNANHPFLFAIVHKPTNSLLFLGRVEDPTAK